MTKVAKNASKLAGSVLVTYWDGTLPVDPVAIALRIGVPVRQADLPPSVSGALIKRKDQLPVILVQESDAKNRKRFTCAHELGHYFDRGGESEYEYIDLRDIESSKCEREDEIFANQFAANLLMPSSLVRQKSREAGTVTDDQRVIFLAAVFGVSTEAIRFRLKNLGLIS